VQDGGFCNCVGFGVLLRGIFAMSRCFGDHWLMDFVSTAGWECDRADGRV